MRHLKTTSFYSFILLLNLLTSCTPKPSSSEFIDSSGAAMIWIPAGAFMMGEDGNVGYRICLQYTDECDAAWFEVESPVHEVYLDRYAIDKYQITNQQFAKFLNEKGNQTENGHTWYDQDYKDALIHQIEDKWQPDPGFEDHPVMKVNWYGANAFCEWRGARLPTEAEWEKAARGGLEGKHYPWGDANPTCEKGALNGALSSQCGGKTIPVGSFAPNGYGIYDMAGNVWEWTADTYQAYPGGADNNLYTQNLLVLRGGSWFFAPYFLRVSSRGALSPVETYHGGGGFRCAKSP